MIAFTILGVVAYFVAVFAFGSWIGKLIARCLNDAVPTDALTPSDHSAWKGNGA